MILPINCNYIYTKQTKNTRRTHELTKTFKMSDHVISVAHDVQNINQGRSPFHALLQLVPDTHPKGVILRTTLEQREKQQQEQSKSYKERRELANTMKDIQHGLPYRVINLMNTLALAMDDEDQETLQGNMFNPDNKDSLTEIIADLLFISNHTEIVKPPREGGNGSRITRAETLARAHSPEWTAYGFCPKCNRPMKKSYIKTHQKHHPICVEIKSGKQRAVQLGKVKDRSIGEFISESLWCDDNQSEDEEQE